MTARPLASISLRGVRTHNLKAVNVDLPLKRLIVVTGPSGAGKSSLAFDTLYSEGHRRYVETFSPYARQFFARLDKPDADAISGIPPAIAVGRRHGRNSPRTTLGTITEIHHSLGLLFARAGQVLCRQCGQIVAPSSPATVVARSNDGPPALVTRLASRSTSWPTPIRRPYSHRSRARGFTRLRFDGQTVALDGLEPPLPVDGSVDVIVDRLIRGSDAAERRADSIETAFDEGLGRCRVIALESRAPTCADGGAAVAGPTISSRSRISSDTTVPSGRARFAKEQAGPWSSTWAGSFPTRPGRSARRDRSLVAPRL